jgi:hypothetical protein
LHHPPPITHTHHAPLAHILQYLLQKEVPDMYIGGGVIAIILIIVLLIWIF